MTNFSRIDLTVSNEVLYRKSRVRNLEAKVQETEKALKDFDKRHFWSNLEVEKSKHINQIKKLENENKILRKSLDILI